MPEWTDGVSVILPVANAAARLPAFFQALARCEVLEVLLCDLGSTDATVAVGRDAGAHVFRTSGDPAEAVNNAAENTRGTAIWFLSPACRPPLYVGHDIQDALASREI